MEPFNIADFVKRAKEALGLKTDQELAKTLGIPRATIASWKNRNSISIEYIQRIAMVTNVSIHWLLTGHGRKYLIPYSGWMEGTDKELQLEHVDIIWFAMQLAIIDIKKHSGEYLLTPKQCKNFFWVFYRDLLKLCASKQDWVSANILTSEDAVYEAIRRQFDIPLPDPSSEVLDSKGATWDDGLRGFDYAWYGEEVNGEGGDQG